MSNWLKWLLLGLAAYLVFLLASFPATHVIGRLTLPQQIQISDVSGTIWNGQANSVRYDGLPINDVKWQLSFLPLLWGQLDLDLRAGNVRDTASISVNGPVSLSIADPNKLETQNLTVFVPADLVVNHLPLPFPVQAKGRIKVDIHQLTFNQQCETLTGKGQWLKAEVPGSRGPIQLGNFEATLGCQEGATLLTISEPNLFGLSAVLRIPADFDFTIDGQFKPDASLPRDVHTAAKFFGEPNAQGYYTINF